MQLTAQQQQALAAQLPPVGDANSRAFDEAYFENMGLKVQSFELTEVLRQSDNAILRNAMLCRKLLINNQFSQLCFEKKQGEVEEVSDMVTKYCNLYNVKQFNNPVLVTYSNVTALGYNQEIRKILFPDKAYVSQDDVLMCMTNNYAFGTDIYNGDFLKVINVEEKVTTRHANVVIELRGRKEHVTVELRFRNAIVQLDDGQIVKLTILDSFLDNENPSLTLAEIKALYIDFKIRNPHLKPQTEEFKDTLKSDPLYNALHVKYGYAITGHKSQGGEWETVFVDYAGQYGTSVSSLRWIYTVTTRAKSHLYSPKLPEHRVFKKFRMDSIVRVNRVDTMPSELQYDPSTPSLAELYEKVQKLCLQLDLEIIDIIEYLSAYHVHYIFKGKNTYSYIDFYVDGKGFLTYGRPSSLMGEQDTELQRFIKLFNEEE